MKTRVFSGIVGVLILLAIVLSSPVIMTLAVAVISVVALSELFTVCNVTSFKTFEFLGYFGDLIILFSIIVKIYKGKNILYAVIYLLILIIFILLMRNLKRVWLKDAAKVLFLTLYIGLFSGALILIRALENGEFLIWFVFIIAFFTDTFALFSGMLFGKRPLCPKISPKKTVEGAIGGVIGSIAGSMLYAFLLNKFFGFTPLYELIGLIAGFGSIVSQLGDLSASAIKREYKIKDYGHIMPGHGGVMDRFDSVFFVAPFIYFIFLIFPVL